MKKSVIILIGLLSAAMAFAQPFSVSFNTFSSTTFDPIIIMRNGTAVPESNLVQVIKTGANGAADPANSITGELGGDDILVSNFLMGEGTLMAGTFSLLITCYPAAERPNVTFPSPGETIYFRIWSVTSVPITGLAHYCQTGNLVIPATDTDVFDVHATPTSASPNWITVNSNIRGMVISEYPNGGLAQFDSVYIGSTSSRRFTIASTGTEPLAVNAPILSGDFSTTYTGGIIPAGTNVSFDVVFTPTTVGRVTSSILIVSNATFTSNHYVVNLEGTGVNIWSGPITPPPNTGNPGEPWSPTFPVDPYTGGQAPCAMNFGSTGTNPTTVTVSLTPGAWGVPPPPWNPLPYSLNIDRSWWISQTGGAGWSLQLRLRFTEADLLSTFNQADPNLVTVPSRLLAVRYSGFENMILDVYPCTFSLVSGEAPNRIWEAVIDGVTGFSRWTIGTGPITLPVTGMTVSAAAGNAKVVLTWTVASELNNSHFLIQRSTGSEFVTIGRVNSRTNDSAQAQSYTFEDASVINNQSYDYKIVNVGLDGFEHGSSRVVTATPHAPVITEYALHQNSPNPFNPTTHITFDLKEAGNVSLVVYDIMGKRVATLASGRFNAGRFTTEYNAENLPAGLYFARLSVNKYSEIRKLVLVK